VDGGLVNTVPVSVCREMGAQYVIGVNVIPEPIKVMCNSNKNQQFQICDLSKLRENGDSPILVTKSKEHRSLQSRIDDMENATKKFLTPHGSKRNGKILEMSVVPKETKAIRFRTKSPKLVDVLSQSLTISEYRLAVENLKGADLAISPDVEGIGFWQFNNAVKAIAAGEHAARKALERNPVPSILNPV
jgi:NTE family protein